MTALTLVVRFACEVAALVAVGWWGFDRGGWPVAASLVAAVAIVWGLLVAPKRRFHLRKDARFAVELAVWIAASAALVGVAGVVVGLLYGVVAVSGGLINYRAA